MIKENVLKNFPINTMNIFNEEFIKLLAVHIKE